MLSHQFSTPTAPGRVVVVGAGGFVGSTLVKQLGLAKVPVLGLTRKEVDLLADDGAKRLRGVLRPDDGVVFVSAVAPAKTAGQMMTNLRMAEAACAAFAAVQPAHLLYISSDAVYADNANPVTERSPVAPSTTHGMMHAARELMLRSEYRGPLAFLRPTLIFGAGDPHSGYGPNRFRRQAANGEPITIFGEGEEKRDHVAVEDVARLAVRILLHRSVGVLNAVTGVATSFHDIANIVAAQFSPRAEVKSVPRPGPRPHLLHRFFDITDLHKSFPDFHFEPLADGLARVHQESSVR
ncbi:NAD-dependent epimerase/dehydratase family protein [Pseudolabrys taiwanensis]|uniref:NAD-dependent epimerase/dehydratase family protein n=1 Tax=Pseudolabrys taiwanensis TaxID=331696 RepID=A0A345ZQ47_9HYPH|nr:NAD-dependent epimerase/dehydratase family protein [Pseudolabrys taiwanensis]AXK79044.1 NAD-dependent epimerase/dehydratase family protein [Pseudolabrys taiwanensis]